MNTIWLFNIAMENDPFIDGLPDYLLKIAIFHGYVNHLLKFRKCSMAMLNNQMVNNNKRPQQQEKWWATLTYLSLLTMDSPGHPTPALCRPD